MNDNNQNQLCSHCGAKIPSNGYCLRCGFNNNMNNQNIVKQPNENSTINTINQVNEKGLSDNFNNYEIVNNYEKEFDNSRKRKNKRNLILALINFIFVFPFIVTFSGLWIIFGPLSSPNFNYSGMAILLIIYVIFTYIALLFSIINMFTKDKVNKTCKIIAVIFVLVCLFGPTISKKKEKEREEKQLIESVKKNNIEEKFILENEKVKIKQKSISYDNDYVKVRYNVEKLDKNVGTCESDYPDFRVNKYYFHKRDGQYYYNSKITVDSATGDCILNISYKDLNEYKIKDIYLIDIWTSYYKASIMTDSIKTNNNGDLEFLENDKYLLHENDYFKVYYDPNYGKNDIKLYFVSKIKEDYEIYLSGEDLDTLGIVNNDIGKYIQLYDYTISSEDYSFSYCNDNLQYYKAHYSIRKDDYKTIIAEGDIDETYDEPIIKAHKCG